MEENNIKSVIYVRVSSKEQEQGYSIPAQLKLLRDYCKKNTLEEVRAFIEVETGKRAGRTAFNEMVGFLKKNPTINIILCEKTDRLYRNFRDYVTLDDFDLEIHLVKEGEILSKDSKSHQKFIHGIKVLMAKNYTDNLSEEARKGMLEKASQGIYPSYAKYGYINVEKEMDGFKIKTIDVEESKAPVIKRLFQLYATGSYSLDKLTVVAYEEGLRSRRGIKIYRCAMGKMLKDPFYYGSFLWNGKLYKGNHPPIITKKLFDLVQQAFAAHNRPSVYQNHEFQFSGLVVCGKCGCAYTAEKKKGKYIYYRCTGRRGKCGNTRITEEALAKQMETIVENIQIDKKLLTDITKVLKRSHKDEKMYHETQLERLQTQYKTLQGRIDKMYIDKLDGKISEDFYEKNVNSWRQEQSNILNTIKIHQNANNNYLEQGAKMLELSQLIYSLYVKQNLVNKRKILNFVCLNFSFIDGSLCATYRKPFNLLVKGPSCTHWLSSEVNVRNFFLSPEGISCLENMGFLELLAA